MRVSSTVPNPGMASQNTAPRRFERALLPGRSRRAAPRRAAAAARGAADRKPRRSPTAWRTARRPNRGPRSSSSAVAFGDGALQCVHSRVRGGSSRAHRCPARTRTELHARLLELCEEFRAQGDIGCEVALDESHTRFDEEVSEVVFRTVRELLANVRQHAQAKQVEGLERRPPRRLDRHHGRRRRHRPAAAPAPRQSVRRDGRHRPVEHRPAAARLRRQCSTSTRPRAAARAPWSFCPDTLVVGD